MPHVRAPGSYGPGVRGRQGPVPKRQGRGVQGPHLTAEPRDVGAALADHGAGGLERTGLFEAGGWWGRGLG